jgi:hypothetical protein
VTTLLFAAIGILLFSIDSRVGVSLNEVHAEPGDAFNEFGSSAAEGPTKSNGSSVVCGD